MDLFFTDPSEIPLPPGEVRIRRLEATPSPDGHRIKVYFEVDPFQKRPSAELVLLSPSGDSIASADIIETMTRKMELNLHLRGELLPGEYTLEAVLFYVDFESPAESGAAPVQEVERQIVDQTRLTFQLA